VIPRDERPEPRASGGPLRALISLGLLAYFAAVIVAPLSGPPPASGLAQALLQPFRPLLGGLYLGHGYRFFAPDPGPGHSIRWTVTLPDGAVRTGTIPDAVTDRPRLLYHRRFMVAEKIAGFVPPPDAPSEVQARARADRLPLVKGVADNLLRAHGGERVTLEMVEHYLPGPEEIVEGRAGSDLITPLGTFARRGRQP